MPEDGLNFVTFVTLRDLVSPSFHSNCQQRAIMDFQTFHQSMGFIRPADHWEMFGAPSIWAMGWATNAPRPGAINALDHRGAKPAMAADRVLSCSLTDFWVAFWDVSMALVWDLHWFNQ